MTIKLGLTGGIASGKSTVATMLAELGASVIDADIGARVVVEPGTAGLAAVVDLFGREVLHPDGTLDRAHLGRIVFGDPEKKRALEAVVHPLVLDWMRRRLQEYIQVCTPLVVLDIPLLFETGVGLDLCDYTAVVWVPVQTQLTRLMRRNGYSQEEAAARIAAQMPLDQKRALADFCIDNSGSPEYTRRQVVELWRRLMSNNTGKE